MLEINRYRLNLYELLYENPTCDYRTNREDGSTEINILFIGDKDRALETYKTMFWASQYPECKMNMAYMGKREDLNYVKAVLNDKKKYPALNEYIGKGYAAPLSYIELRTGIIGEDIINVGKGFFKYIIVATGDAYRDWEYLSEIEALGEKALEEILVAVYNDGLEEKFRNINWNKVAKNVRIIQFEKTEEEINRAELKRIAANINLAYSMLYNERLNIENNLKEFGWLCKDEFDTMDALTYDADSSYASAVHITSKLSYCLEYEKIKKDKTDLWKETAMKVLSEATVKENRLYKKLYYWEHRRWNAYTVMKGYRQPEKDEWDFVYTNGRKNVEKDKKLHVCLCESGDELNADMEHPTFWRAIKKQISPLDYASYRCNLIAASKSKELEKIIYTKYEFINGIWFQKLKEAIENLFIEVSNANDDYRKIYTKLLQMPEISENKMLLKRLEEMNKELDVVITRNKHINFFKYDAQLVQLIPFAEWYGRKYSEVFVFSQGIAAKEVVVPTILYAPRAYFILDKVSDTYKKIICRYFEERGSNTKPYFLSYDEMLKYTENKSIDEYVIAGEGEEKEDYLTKKNNVINVRYDAEKSALNKEMIFGKLNKQSFSVREFIRLQGGDINREFRDTLSKKTYSEYEKLFWKYSDFKKDGNYNYIPWNKVIKIFTKDSREQKGKVRVPSREIELETTSNDVVYVCDTCLSQEKYLNNMVDKFLISLSNYHLISKYSAVLEEQSIRVRFLTYHKEICKIIMDYSKMDDNYNVVRLSVGHKDLCKDNMITQSSKEFCIDLERCQKVVEFRAEHYEELLKELKTAGVIDKYEIRNDLLRTVTVRDMRVVLNLFEKEGDIFEKITYHRFRNSGLFDDVRNGVYFYWNRDTYDKMLQHKKLMKMVETVSEHDIIGLIDADTFCQIHNQVFATEESDYEKTQVSNEIDVIATRGMQAYFVSCKASADIVMNYELEIANHAKNAGAIPVLCTSKTIESNSDAILSRASEVDNIIFMGRQELMEQNRFNTIWRK